MTYSILRVAALGILIAGMVLLWRSLRKHENKNTVLTIDPVSLAWNEIKCIKCNKPMESGFSFAGNGITFIAKHGKKPGVFTVAGSALENTRSLRIPSPVNMSWFCDNCKILVFDNSKMLKLKRP